MDWSECGSVLFRSTWDYFERFAEFSPWLEAVSAQTRLFNEAGLIRWNVDKHYLADLAQRGVAVVPTRFLARGAQVSLASVMAEEGWDEIVFKPVVSGAARLTYRVSASALAEHEAVFARCLAQEAMMVQRFEPAIVAVDWPPPPEAVAALAPAEEPPVAIIAPPAATAPMIAPAAAAPDPLDIAAPPEISFTKIGKIAAARDSKIIPIRFC